MSTVTKWLALAFIVVVGVVDSGAAGAVEATGAATPVTSGLRAPASDQETPTGGVWHPRPGVTWHWQIEGRISQPFFPVRMYDIDLEDAVPSQRVSRVRGFGRVIWRKGLNAGVIGRLHTAGRIVICYVDTGAWESYRPDAGLFPRSVIGNRSGWPGERWLDIRRPAWSRFAPIMWARFDLASEVGCDGVEPDQNNPVGNNPGFPITLAHEKAWFLEVARQAHAVGLSVGMKNGVEVADTDTVRVFDWALNEECIFYRECRLQHRFVTARKAVFHTEYVDDWEARGFDTVGEVADRVCPRALDLRFSTVIKRRVPGPGWSPANETIALRLTIADTDVTACGAMGADVVIIMTDQERAVPSYEPDDVTRWRDVALPGRRWFVRHGVSFTRHYTGSVACVPSRPTMFTGQYPFVHGLTQTDGLAKTATDSAMRWLRPGSVPTLGNWFRAASHDAVYIGKWHISHADLHDDDGGSLQTNTDDGVELAGNVARYRVADVLDPFGFSGWVGPEPHGPLLANSGLRRDPLTADRAVAWLEDRYRRRRAGDVDAGRPFLLVVSFVNPHDIVFFPAWFADDPVPPLDPWPPSIPPSPTDAEDLCTKPAAQRAFRDCYPSAYGPVDVIRARYEDGAEQYRALYYRLHHLVDGHIDRVRRTITEEHAAVGGDVVLVRTADHGELLGAHGGLHQKWFNLYDEGTRVPFEVVRLGAGATNAARVDVPTSHVDLVPTLLSQIDADVDALSSEIGHDFDTLELLPGRDLSGLLADPRELLRGDIYMMTRDNILEGDSDASLAARALGQADDPPEALRINVPVGVGSSFEAIVAILDVNGDGDEGGDRRGPWKLVRTSGAAVGGADGDGDGSIANEWELYNLGADPFEAHNLVDLDGNAGDHLISNVFTELRARLAVASRRAGAERASTVT